MASIVQTFVDKAEELQAILDGITEPLLLIDSDYRIKRVNRATLDFCDESDYREILGKKCFVALYGRGEVCPYCPMKDSSGEEQLQSFNEVFESGTGEVTREIFQTARGPKETLLLSFFPMEKNGTVYAIVETIKNITRQKEKEEESLRMRNLASLGIFISGVAHELNNPLTGMSLTLQNLLNGLSFAKPESIQRRLEMIKEDLSRAAMIVSDIISFAKPDKLVTTKADIRETILKAKESITWVYPILSKNVEWEINCEEEVSFQFNPVKMERLFMNFFKNSLQAFDYRPGKIKVDVRKTKRRVHIFVEDNAGGIPDSAMDKIFSPFYTKNKSGMGTGLGLSICHSIVKEHQGEISVRSYDIRTRFRVSLPQNPVSEPNH